METKDTVNCRQLDGMPGGAANFARGSFRLKDIVEFEVVGAIEEALQKEDK